MPKSAIKNKHKNFNFITTQYNKSVKLQKKLFSDFTAMKNAYRNVKQVKIIMFKIKNKMVK